MISLCKRRVWLVVDNAPTCPRCSTFWGKDSGGQMNLTFAPACVRARMGSRTRYAASLRKRLGKWLCHGITDAEIYLWPTRAGKSHPTPPVQVHAMPPYFLYFLGIIEIIVVYQGLTRYATRLVYPLDIKIPPWVTQRGVLWTTIYITGRATPWVYSQKTDLSTFFFNFF